MCGRGTAEGHRHGGESAEAKRVQTCEKQLLIEVPPGTPAGKAPQVLNALSSRNTGLWLSQQDGNLEVIVFLLNERGVLLPVLVTRAMRAVLQHTCVGEHGVDVQPTDP